MTAWIRGGGDFGGAIAEAAYHHHLVCFLDPNWETLRETGGGDQAPN